MIDRGLLDETAWWLVMDSSVFWRTRHYDTRSESNIRNMSTVTIHSLRRCGRFEAGCLGEKCRIKCREFGHMALFKLRRERILQRRMLSEKRSSLSKSIKGFLERRPGPIRGLCGESLSMDRGYSMKTRRIAKIT